MSDLWFTSDLHFGHKNIIKFANRPFNDLEEMQEALIDNWNKLVSTGDRVYVLGDMFWRTYGENEALTTLKRLKGQKYYIWGNHEELLEKNSILQSQFIWCKDIAKVAIQHPLKKKIVLCHYAMRVWDGSHRGDYMLYGHSHNELDKPDVVDKSLLSLDVGVDSWDYKPVSIDQIVTEMQERVFNKVSNLCMYKCECGRVVELMATSSAICTDCCSKMEKVPYV